MWDKHSCVPRRSLGEEGFVADQDVLIAHRGKKIVCYVRYSPLTAASIALAVMR